MKWIAGNNGFVKSTKENNVISNDPLDKKSHPSIFFIKQDLLDPSSDMQMPEMDMEHFVYIGNLSVSKELGSFDELKQAITNSFGGAIGKSLLETYESKDMQYDNEEEPYEEMQTIDMEDLDLEIETDFLEYIAPIKNKKDKNAHEISKTLLNTDSDRQIGVEQ